MFDIGFLELALIAVVGLLVVGPEQLPHAIKSCIRFITKFKRFMSTTKQEIESQIGVDEIRRELHNEEVLKSIEALKIAQQDITSSAKAFSRTIEDDPTLNTEENRFSDSSLAHTTDDELDDYDDGYGDASDIKPSPDSLIEQAKAKQEQEQITPTDTIKKEPNGNE